MPANASKLSTAAGVLAVLLWSSTVCLCGALTAKLGALTAASFIYILAGAMHLAVLLPRRGIKAALKIDKRRLFVCGGPFVLYIVAFYMAIGMVKDGRQLIEVGLINYFWPALILLLSVPLQGNKASLLLPAGVAVSLAGIFMASSSFNGGLSLGELLSNLASRPLPYALAFAGALLWALYSNFSRIYEKESSEAEIPLFMLMGGLLLLPAGPLFGETQSWDLKTAITLFATALFPGVMACVLWDIATRKGNFVFVSAFSYLIPLFSTVLTGLAFGIPLPLGVWGACVLVVAGAALCHFSIKPKAA